MTGGMIDDALLASLLERFVVCFESIAKGLGDFNETYRRHLERLHPERKEYREAHVTRVKNEDDRIREAQGASGQPLDQWLSEVEDEEEENEFIGVREREWLDAQKPDRREEVNQRAKED